jgi:putative membrane protein
MKGRGKTYGMDTGKLVFHPYSRTVHLYVSVWFWMRRTQEAWRVSGEGSTGGRSIGRKEQRMRLNAKVLMMLSFLAAFPVTDCFAQMGGYMGPGMMGWGYGMGWGWSIIMIAFWIAVIAGIIFLIRWIVMSTDKGKATGGEDSALEILRKRYARGEINKQEFEEKKKDLER